MQNTEAKKTNQNKIYELAKKSLTLKNEKKDKILSKIGELIDDAFEKNNVEFIDEATNIAYKNSELEIFNVISDEIQISVECMLFEQNEHIYDSNIMLLPVMFKTLKNAEVTLPSIEELEKRMKSALVNSGKYPNADFINLAIYRFDQETAENLSIKEWWDSHKDIVEHFGQEEDEDSSNKTEHTQVTVEDGFLLTYYILHLHQDIENEEIPDLSVLDDKDFWKTIFKPLHQTAQLWIEALPPSGIFESITNGKILLENERLQSFLSDYVKPELELLLIPVEDTEDPSQYAVIMVDSEDRTLYSFYVYDIHTDTREMFEIINEKALQVGIPVFKANKPITVDELNGFSKSEYSVDFNKVFKDADYLNLEDSFMGLYGYSKYQRLLN